LVNYPFFLFFKYWSPSRCGWWRAAPSSPYTRPTQQLSRPPSIQKLGAEHRMLQLKI